ncbi:ninein isoform X2 [Cynoglossus semilaevis]|uniref:ninein isoform X2 n=1 Tax=Cynoglossus semilaevis TaxID=244447 RepID=UPI0007DCA0B3|nr:ninein isoform X2 [Cynoglossus semilaevis]XP_024917619.1 ninein isoform X2 [Cynoglossus semilaevis]
MINVSALFGRVLSCGMDDVQEQDQYEEQLKEVFNSFDTSGCGSLCPEELSELCQSLHLDEATPVLIQTLLQNQDHLTARIDFDQFKNALILVLSSTFEQPQAEQEPLQKAASPEIQPKFVKGSKRYGRRSTPELIDPISSLSESTIVNPAEAEDLEDNYDSAVPRKRERWNANESSTEEYEAEGQMHLWNPDEPSTPRTSTVPLSSCLEERLREACEELSISWDRCVDHTELLAVCEHLGLEIKEDDLLNLTSDGVMNVQEFVSQVVNHNKPPTPSASTPYRQLKRHHSMQPFDEGGRRIATPSTLTSTIGTRLFSSLDDGTGFTSVEYILDAWTEDGIENSYEILQALNFDLNGKLSLGDLAMALENELLVTKNGIHQAVLASFKAEIRHLLECVDREYREKEKIRSDLEKAEKLKNQLATEVDEHHSAIEQTNNLKLRKLEQDHKEKLTAVRSELMIEMDRIQQQAGLQREELEAEMGRIREDESFLRDHLSISVKENRRLEMELLDSREKLVDAEVQITKLQTTLDNVMKEKFGDLDPGRADFLHQEERIKQLHSGYEAQCRELQDRIDELQSELQQFHNLGRVHQSCNKPLSEELESKSPGNESDPGIGSEEVQPFNLNLEAEMMLERLKEQHLQEVEELQNQLESKISEFDQMVEKQRTNHEDHEAVIVVQHQQAIQSLRDENSRVQSQMQELQSRLKQAELERCRLEQNCSDEKEELENLREEEVGNLRQQLLEAHTLTADLEEQLQGLETQLAEMEGNCHSQVEELKDQQAAEIKKLEEKHVGLLEIRLKEEQNKHQTEKTEAGKRFWDELENLKQSHDLEMKTKLEEAKLRLQEEQREVVERLEKQWEEDRAQLNETNEESLQVQLKEEMLKLVREHEEKVKQLREQWTVEQAKLQQHYEATTLQKISEERSRVEEHFEQKEKKLKEIWKEKKVQMEKDYEVRLEVRLSEERAKLEAEKEEVKESLEKLLAAEKTRVEKRHQVVIKELMTTHWEEREALSSMLEKLRDDIAKERSESCRLAEENLVFRKKIDALKEEDLKSVQEELTQTLEQLVNEKSSAQNAAENFQQQIAELHFQSLQLEDENNTLSEKNIQNVADMEHLQKQLEELMEEREKREALPSEDKNMLSACVTSLEAELTKALEDTAQLEERNSQLSEQMSGLTEKLASMENQLIHLLDERKRLDKENRGLRDHFTKAEERVKKADETSQAVHHQSARLKADVRVLQKERDSLKHELAVLHKRLQNASDKNRVLERTIHSGSLQSHGKKLLREELSLLMEQEQLLLRQDNERLQAEVRNIKGDLVQSKEKVRQLDANLLSLKQQNHPDLLLLVKALEQENVSLKQELEAQKEQAKGCEAGQGRTPSLENLQQENDALRDQLARMSTQLLESFQAHFLGLLPPSPHRLPRGQNRGEEVDHQQDERERKMKNMEERMREVELSLHNVKLLLKEKVVQLKEQLNKNGKADVLIKDLYVENTQLLKALEITEQRQKLTEKKNYLLEEKICSLNKIVRDLNPTQLSSLPYHYKNSS